MRLYLIRHAKAEKRSAQGDDFSRALTERGLRQAAWLGERLAGETGDGLRLLASPARRAQETAEAISSSTGAAIETISSIGLDAGASRVVDVIQALEPGGPVALVGHNPTFSLAAEMLLNGPGSSSGLELRTGQAAVLEIEDVGAPIGGATLVALLRMPEDA